MSNELRQAAQQALNALDEATTYTGSPSWSPSMTDECIAAASALRTAPSQQPATPEPVAWSEREQLRHAQAAVVMPMIGPLLDAWENSDREVMSQEPELSKQLKNINSAMEDAQPATGEPVQATPNFTQLMQILDGLNRCHSRDSKVEFLRSWIRDWTQHKVDKLTHPAPSVPDDVVRDAERYEWLRQHQLLAKINYMPTPSGEDLDAAIDAAMLAAK